MCGLWVVFELGMALSRLCGRDVEGKEGLVNSVQNRGLGVCAPQLLRFILLVWHFTCRFDFRHKSKIAIYGLPFVAAFAVLWAKGGGGGEGLGEGLVVVPVGTMGSFLPRDSLFRAVEGSGGLWTLSKIDSLARARLAFRGLSCW